jgi:NDP-sugar pyrophosphorylase family protein
MHPVAVLAGGLGTRLRDVTGDDLPKVMVPVAGQPFIDHKLRELRDKGASDVLLLLGHGAEAVRDHVGDGAAHGLRVEYRDDGDALLGTGGALLRALPQLGDRFWVTYGDTLLDVDVVRAERTAAASDARGLMTVLHNRDRWQPSNVVARDGHVAAYTKDPRPPGAEHIDYGMLLFDARAFSPHAQAVAFDLATIVVDLVDRHALLAFEVTERFHDIGTPDALSETEAWLWNRA